MKIKYLGGAVGTPPEQQLEAPQAGPAVPEGEVPAGEVGPPQQQLPPQELEEADA